MQNETIINVRADSDAKPFRVLLAGITHPDKNYRITREMSTTWVLEYVIRGAGYVQINDTHFPVDQGDVYILPKWTRHNYFADEHAPFEKIWFNADGDLIPHLLSLYGLAGVYKIRDAHPHCLFEQFLKQCTDDPENLSDILALLFHRIVQELAKHSGEKQIDNEAQIICRYIDRNLHEKIELSQLAKLIYRSVSQTIRIFKRQTGETPYEYVLRKRLQNAQLLLEHTNLPIHNIAQRLQFSDEHYFSSYFKQRCGLSPSQYRKDKKTHLPHSIDIYGK